MKQDSRGLKKDERMCLQTMKTRLQQAIDSDLKGKQLGSRRRKYPLLGSK